MRPLAWALRSLGVSVWYDEFSLKLGDSLSGSIDKGIADSEHGVVVISLAFFEKPVTFFYSVQDLVFNNVWFGVGSLGHALLS